MGAKVGIKLYKLKGQIDKGGHYDVEKKGWMERGQYDVQIKRVAGYGRAL